MTASRPALLLVVAALGCSEPHVAEPDASAPTRDASAPDADAAVAPVAYGERCGNGIDDDGDGLIDEDCPPSLFAGVFAPDVAADPAAAEIEAATGRPLSVLQTYRSTKPGDVDLIAPDLAAIFARGSVAHLNVEPAGYTAQQYATPHADPLATDLPAMGAEVASALAAQPTGRVILTFGAEMNGNWTDWGCLPAGQYIALFRAAHDAVTAALAAAKLDPRRVRWAYGPNSTSSSSCGSAAGYYPGHAYVDLLGMSAYRSGTASVDEAVVAPMSALFDALAYPVAWRRDRFVLLQTGSREVTGDDRDAWIRTLFTTLTHDERAAGLIYFDAADWAVASGGPGWAGLTTAIADAPVADRQLDGIFRPHFWDVAYGDAAFPEIEALVDAGVTSGCDTGPARFCPDDPIRAVDATTMLARAGMPSATLTDPVTEAALAVALGAAPAAPSIATRARAAVLIAHAARLAPMPL